MADKRWECSMCGRDGGPITGCSSCHGNVRFLVESKGATLSDYRSGRVKEDQHELGPKTDSDNWQGHNKNG